MSDATNDDGPVVNSGAPDNANEAALEEVERQKRIYKFWIHMIQCGEPQPAEEWDDANRAYEQDVAKGDRSRVNLFRKNIDTIAAHVSDEIPAVKVTTPAAWSDDAIAMQMAECDEALVAALDDLMDYTSSERKALRVALIQNTGIVIHGTDVFRQVPNIRTIRNEQVMVDGDCKGDLDNAGWIAYYEYVSPESLKVRFGLDEDQMFKLKKASYVPPPVEMETSDIHSVEILRKAREHSEQAMRKCKLWCVYARAEFALYDQEPARDENDEESSKPHFERYRDREGMNEPRRYLEFVEGYEDGPLIDETTWPKVLAIDYNDWPITTLSFNASADKFWGFTDFRHNERLLDEHEKTVGDMTSKMASNGSTFGTGPGCTMDDIAIKQTLERKGIKVITGALDQNGNQQLKRLDLGQINDTDLKYEERVQQLIDDVSGVPKVLRSEELPGQTATASKLSAEAADAETNVRLRKYERFVAKVRMKILRSAHAMMQMLTQVEVMQEPEPVAAEMVAQGMMAPEQAEPQLAVQPMPWALAQEALKQPGTQLVSIGVEALVGQRLSVGWKDGMPLDVIRTMTQVHVERGSGQRRTRLEKAAAFKDVSMNILFPLIDLAVQAGMVDMPTAITKKFQAAEKILHTLDLEEYETVLPQLGQPPPMSVIPGVPAPGSPATPTGTPVPPGATSPGAKAVRGGAEVLEPLESIPGVQNAHV